MVNKLIFLSTVATILCTFPAFAEKEIALNTAQMQAMDKITGRVSIIEVPVGGEVKFGSFSVVVRNCKTRPEGEIPENFAFVDVSDKSFDQKEYNIFKGWMFSSKPAINAVEHPIYDVWLLKCINTPVEQSSLMSPEELALRDELPRLQEVKAEQDALKKNDFAPEERQNIYFKDSMYRDNKNQTRSQSVFPAKIDGEPENLLNIKDSFEEYDEDIVSIPAEDLSLAISQEAEKLNKENISTPIDDELTSAIDKELAQHPE